MSNYTGTVQHGDKQGRTISFPTINLDPSIWPADKEPGVYSSHVQIGQENFIGALYYGPRTTQNETFNVLEIFLLDFSKEIYGETVTFSLHQFIRPVIHFSSFEELKQQITLDVDAVQASLKTTNTTEKSHGQATLQNP